MVEDDAKTKRIIAVHEGTDIMWGAKNGNLIDIHGGAHDSVFDVLAGKIERFANGGIPHGTEVGLGVWLPDETGTYRLDRIELRDEIVRLYGVGNVNVTEEDLKGTPYET